MQKTQLRIVEVLNLDGSSQFVSPSEMRSLAERGIAAPPTVPLRPVTLDQRQSSRVP